MTDWIATRAEGEKIMAAFTPRMGRRYASGRNTDHGPADVQNIAAFTAGRFAPRPGDLAQVTQGPQATEPDGLSSVLPLRPFTLPVPGRPTALMITDQDCRVEDFDLAGFDIRTVATLSVIHLHSPLPVADMVVRFEADAWADAALRVGASSVLLSAAHRWRYARVTQALGQPFLCSPDATLYLGGDWCIGARVEAAWSSGRAIAGDILAPG